MIQQILRFAGFGILLEAVFLNYMNAVLPKKYVVWSIFIFNTLLAVPDFFETFKRMGVDYTAYVQQGGAFFRGETNYENISSHQGHCYYPGGHLMHYYVVYWLHL